MKDWLGNEYGVGDLVLYAAQSGHCINMVLARVLDFTFGKDYMNRVIPKVKVLPLKSSRWKMHYTDPIKPVFLTITENIVKWGGTI